MERSIEEIVEHVDSADVSELRNVEVEDVYRQMDHVMAARPSPLDLYRRWESQQWAVSDLNFEQDREHWTVIPLPVRTFLQSTFTLFFIGEQAVTDTLSPLILGAPTEDDRIFLSTQIADEARHTVFFKRFFEEVVGVEGGLHGALEAVRPGAVGGFRKIFDEQLVALMDRVRLDPHDYGAWIRGLTCYHLIIEGMLALTGQKFALRTIRRAGILPGFYAGFTAVTRDESRHVNYGVGAARDATVRGHAQDIEAVVDDLLESVCRTIVAPERKLMTADPETIPADARVNPREVQDFSIFSLTKRLHVIGLSDSFIAHVKASGREYYDACIAEYEQVHSEAHPIRWYDEHAS